MFVDVLLIVVFPVFGAFFVIALRALADNKWPGFEFGNEVALELIALSLGGLAAAAHNPKVSQRWAPETTTFMSVCFMIVFSCLIVLLLLRRFFPASTTRHALRDASLGLISLLVLFAVIWSGS